jgi:hypothetical protein
MLDLYHMTAEQLDALTAAEFEALPIVGVPPGDFRVTASVVTTATLAASAVHTPTPTATVVAGA